MTPDTIWSTKYYGILAVILVLAFLLYMVWGARKKPQGKHHGYRATDLRTNGYTIPSHPAELARYIRTNLTRLREAKRQGHRRSAATNRWLDSLAHHIATYGLETATMSVEAKFAALFVVNRKFHGGERRRMEEKKAFLQRTIVVHHRAECTIHRPWGGRFSGTVEASYGIWSTHLPVRLLKGGHYERRGKPSAATAVGHSGTSRPDSSRRRRIKRSR